MIFRAARTLFLTLLFSVTVTADNTAPQTKQETQSPKVRAIGRRLEEKGITNFGEVTPHLYRGGLVRGDGIKAIKKLGINIVVDTHANDTREERNARALVMQYGA